jgi:8-oxo-dGTP pyrophosphatase MutT (NUDIX family)
MTELVSETSEFDGVEIKQTWFGSSELSLDSLDLPITQCYGICYTENLEILTFKKPGKGRYNLPGGTPDSNEDLIATLRREVLEEVDVEVDSIEYLGAIQVEFLIGSDERSGLKKFYQLRFIAKIKNILEQTPDPDNGEIYERVFVPCDVVTEYIKWGKIGEAMFRDANNRAKIL